MAGIAALARPVTSALAGALEPLTPANFSVPTGACDCHVHIYGDPQIYPFVASRGYTPATVTVAELRSVNKALHIDRVVIVQTTVYGTDHSCMLDAIKELGAGARGVAIIDEKTSDSELDRLHRAGIRGAVIHKIEDFKFNADRIKGRGWHIGLYARLSELEAIQDQVIASPVPVLLYVFGGAQAAGGVHQPGFDTLLNLVHNGKAYISLSAPYRISNQAPDFPDVVPIAKALIAANPERIVWSSDWPHLTGVAHKMPEVTPMDSIDDGSNLNQLAAWTSDPAHLKLILVENPARLYGF
jgi:predicted TIM-barrel fold metal-dependent hydrolase